MARLFISHSSRNDAEALALESWLHGAGWGKEDIYLDISPEGGMAAGQRWVEALDDAQRRCEAIIFLVSKAWLSAKWCREEYDRALQLNKKMFALIIDDDVDLSDLPQGLTSQWQAVSIVAQKGVDTPTQRFDTEHPITRETDIVRFTMDGLTRLRHGLTKAAIAPESFSLQKDPEGPLGWRMPYRGLEPLEAKDAAVFFGRDAEITQGLDVLRGLASKNPPRFMVILGASGAGKSSFLRAGLLPRLERDDTNWLPIPPVRSGDDGPIEAPEGLLAQLHFLHQRLGLESSRASLRRAVQDGESFVSCLQNLRQAAHKSALLGSDRAAPLPVLSIDQAEELFVSDAHEDTNAFLKLVRGAMMAGEVVCIATIRSDRYSALQSENILEGIEQTTFSLPPVVSGQLAQIINGPAEVWRREAGPAAPVFAPEVSKALMEEISGQQDALPLLAFAMSRLINDHIGSDNTTEATTITLEDLKATGGVAKTIELEANKALHDAGIEKDPKTREGVLRDAFIPRLARVDKDSRNFERRVASLSDFSGARLRDLVNAFVQRRLLTLKATDGDSSVEVAHEALLRKWPTLSKILEAEKEDLLRLDTALTSSTQWEANGKTKDYIDHRGGRLEELKTLSAKSSEWEAALAPAREYIRVSEKLQIRNKRYRNGILLSVLSLAFIFFGIVFFQASNTATETKNTLVASLNNQSDLLAAFSNSLIKQNNHDAAALVVAESVNHAPEFIGNRDSSAIEQLSAIEKIRSIQYDFISSSDYTRFSPDDHLFLTLSPSYYEVTVWESANASSVTKIDPDGGSMNFAEFSWDGKKIITLSENYKIQIWDSITGRELASFGLDIEKYEAFPIFLSPHDEIIVTDRTNKNFTVFDFQGSEIVSKASLYSDFETIVMSPNGEIALVGHSATKTNILDLETFKDKWTLSHREGLQFMEFSKNGEYILALFNNGPPKVWNASSGSQVSQIRDNAIWGESIFHPNGTSIAAHVDEGIIGIWEVSTGRELAKILNTDDFEKVIFSPTGESILTVSKKNEVQLWDAETGLLLFKLKNLSEVSSVVFSPNGNQILTSSEDGTARVWSHSSGALIHSFTHVNPMIDAVYSLNGKRIVTTSAGLPEFYGEPYKSHTGYINTEGGNTIRVWNIDDYYLSEPEIFNDIGGLASLDVVGNRLLTIIDDFPNTQGSDTTKIDSSQTESTTGSPAVLVTDRYSGEALTILRHDAYISSAEFSPDGKYIATASDYEAILWDSVSGKKVFELTKDNESTLETIWSLQFSPDGKLLATVQSDTSIRIWNVISGDEIEAVRKIFAWHENLGPIAFSDDNENLIAKTESWNTEIFRLNTLKKVADLKSDEEINYAEYTRNSDKVMVVANDIIRILEVGSLKEVVTLHHDGEILFARISPDGKFIISSNIGAGILNNPFQVWDVERGEKIKQILVDNPHYVAGFSPNGNQFFVVDENSASIRDSRTGNEIFSFSHEEEINSIKFNATGGGMVSSSTDNVVKIWTMKYISMMSTQSTISFSALAKVSSVCLTPRQRTEMNLSADPPCWCQEKKTPTRLTWAEDYYLRGRITDKQLKAYGFDPKLGNILETWPEDTPRPTSFTHPRDDGWVCPPANEGYSAPWLRYPDLSCLDTSDILGPADTAIDKLRTDEVCVAAFKEYGMTVDNYLGLADP